MSSLQREKPGRPSGRWQPPGHRWGVGSRSVVPYLSEAIQSRLVAMNEVPRDDGPIRNPVFDDMGILMPPRA